jgi:hypothetical protein
MQKEGSYGPKNAIFSNAACAFVRKIAFFGLVLQKKIDPMPEYVGKIYINKIANQPSSKAEHPHYRAN